MVRYCNSGVVEVAILFVGTSEAELLSLTQLLRFPTIFHKHPAVPRSSWKSSQFIENLKPVISAENASENCTIIFSSTRPFCSVLFNFSHCVFAIRSGNFHWNPPKNEWKRLLKHNQTYMSGSFMLCAVRKSIKAAKISSFSAVFLLMLGGNV